MFVSDKILFLELQKTGCTHIRELLEELVGGQLMGKHNQADRHLFTPGRIFLGSVRDPWDWYVSLWAFGCHRQGTVFGNVTTRGIKFKGRHWKDNPFTAMHELLQSRPNRIAHRWRRTYQDVNDPGAFREWLHMMHDKDNRPDVEGYAHCGAGRVAGYLTYSYLKLFACRKGETGVLNAIATDDQLADFEARHCFIDHFIRNDHLEADLLAALKSAGFEFSATTESKLLVRPRTNATSRSRNLGHYYDAASEQLVDRWDRLVASKFGYVMPSLRGGAAEAAPLLPGFGATPSGPAVGAPR
jgi:hypothetical protein